jgi:hypothetical protein
LLHSLCGGKSKRPQLKLSAEEIEHLEELRDSRTVPWRETQRARVQTWEELRDRIHQGISETTLPTLSIA